MASCGDTASLTKCLLGLGFWIQGFRVFPWVSVRFFLKDGLRVSPAVQQLILSSVDIPMVAKPFYGVVSDAVYIAGAHRLPYIIIGVALQVIAWTVLLTLLPGISTLTFSILLLTTVFGAAIVEVINDAIVAEVGRGIQSLPSFIWMFDSSGGFFGFLLSAFTINHFSPSANFLFFALLLTMQLLITTCIPEQSLCLSHYTKTAASPSRSVIVRKLVPRQQFIQSNNLSVMSLGPPRKMAQPSCIESIRIQFQLLSTALQRKDILHSVCWYALSDAVIPSLSSIMMSYHLEILKVNSSVYSLSKVSRQGWIFVWGIAYESWFKKINSRRLLSALQWTIVFFQFSDALFVKGVYRQMGVADQVYVMTFSGMLEALVYFKILPFTVLMNQLCPPSCEASVMALVMSTSALSSICSAYLGSIVASLIGIAGHERSRLLYAILTQAMFTIIPVYWCSWIPTGGQRPK